MGTITTLRSRRYGAWGRQPIDRLMHERGITQDDLAEYVGVTGSAVSAWVRGFRAPSPADARAVTAYLNRRLHRRHLHQQLWTWPEPADVDRRAARAR